MRKIKIILAVLVALSISVAYANCPRSADVKINGGSYTGVDNQGRTWDGSQVEGRSGTIEFDSVDARGFLDSLAEQSAGPVIVGGKGSLSSIECKYRIGTDLDNLIVLTKFFEGDGKVGERGYQLTIDKHLDQWKNLDVGDGSVMYQCGKTNKGTTDCPFTILRPK